MMNSFFSLKRPRVRDTKAIALFVSLQLVCAPLAGTTAQARFRSRTAQQTTSPESNAQADKVKELAAKLLEAKTEEERAALLEKEKELITGELLQALNDQGKRFENQNDYANALAAHFLAQRVAEQLGDRAGAATATGRVAENYLSVGNNAQALAYALKTLAAHEALGNKVGEAIILNFIGIINHQLGNYSEALGYYRKSLVIRQERGEKAPQAATLRNIGNIYTQRGNYDAALDHYNQSLAIVEELKDDAGLASTLNNMGVVYENHGDLAKAMDYYRKSLAIRQRLGNKRSIATALNNIGLIYYGQGEYAQALVYLRQSLDLRQAINDNFGISSTLGNIGLTYKEMGDGAQAQIYFQQGLVLAEKMENKTQIATLLNRIGDLAFNAGDYPKALESYEKSLAHSEAGGKVRNVESLNGKARTFHAQGKHQEALEVSERASSISRQIGVRELLWEARTTSGKAHRALDQLTEARQAFEEAIAVVESLRANVAGQESRAAYFAKVQEPYELYTDLLMQLHRQRPSEGHDAVALQTSERARARSLLESLREARADIRHGVDPALLTTERTLRQRLNASAERQTRLLSGKHTETQAAAVKKEVDELTAKLQEVREQIRSKSPRYAALTQPAPLDLKEIQALLDADTLLLEYALGEERSYLWAVTPTSISSFELPKRYEIESEVRRAVSLLSDGKQWTTSDKVEVEYAAVTARLSQMLLAPVAEQLKRKRLVIVSDGALQYLPFSALNNPKSGTSTTSPLIADFETVNLPSASTLAILRRETANRTRATGSVAVLADPVFEETDQRVLAAISQNKSGATASVSKVRDTALPQVSDSRAILERAFRVEATTNGDGAKRESLKISRLPFTRFEAEGILASAPRTHSFKATDFRANRATATSADLSKYRYIHFATHGILNTEHPELSGVVLSLVDEKGQPVDGYLRLHEIYNLNLPADLVVLSACQTGLGKEIRGEGLVGLTRGFMYAGAPRVVASLWKVDDAATAELMKRFYRGMLKDKLRPAAALRLAKIEMWKQKRWNAPFYWAAFELQGEWK